MAAYAIGDVEVLDEDGYAEYRRRFDDILAKFGGRILVNGGHTEAKEGAWVPRRLVVLEFPSLEHARRWFDSPEYGEIAPIRHEHAKTHFLTFVDGWPG
jgi:uncharacterized protein (DUF1330 family)